MSLKLPPQVSADFIEVCSHLRQRGILEDSVSNELTSHLRTIHRFLYSIILWRFRLKGINACGRPFLEEMASDALQVMPHVVMGFSKTSRLLVRGIIENALRHVYFNDHPVEFVRLNSPKKWFIQFKELVEYLRDHPHHESSAPWQACVGDLNSIYSELSVSVHGQKVSDLEMHSALAAICCTEKSAGAEVGYVRRASIATNSLLAIYHRRRFSSFAVEDRRIILRTLPRSTRLAVQTDTKEAK